MADAIPVHKNKDEDAPKVTKKPTPKSGVGRPVKVDVIPPYEPGTSYVTPDGVTIVNH